MDQEQEATHRYRKPLILPHTFAEGSFCDWNQHFECVAGINGWNDVEKLQWMHVRLTGKAHVALTRGNHDYYYYYYYYIV